MAKISEALTYGLTIRESATDGSDFTNPATDYRRLFLGEDGQLHVKDSAGTVTDIGAGGSVATDAIWDAAGDLAVGTGANTAAKLTKGADGGVLAMGNGAVIWNAGTSFPGSKATGDRYFRTDLGLEFFWDGTRWVTVTLYDRVQHLGNGATTNIGTLYHPTWGTAPQMWLVDMFVSGIVATTNNGSHYWNVYLYGRPSATTYTTTTASWTADAYTVTKTAIGALVATSDVELCMEAAKNGSPGAANLGVGYRFRFVAT